jgi:hypothetical protein
MRARLAPALAWLLAAAAGAGCSGPGQMSVDGIPGWTRTGPPELYRKDGLYGYIDGGAEIVLQYGFRELSVMRFRPTGETPAGSAPDREITLEIYRMDSGEDAFGLYSTKLEGGEKARPGIAPDNWSGGGQASLVKGEYMINLLAPGRDDRETGEFLAQVERRAPGRGTIRPRGMAGLPPDGMVPSSWHFIKGPLAAQNESPFLGGSYWGFEADPGKADATTAFSAKYGAPPAVSKLVLVEIGRNVRGTDIDDGVLSEFREDLMDVEGRGAVIKGRNEGGRWFLYRRDGSRAVLILGETDEALGRARLDAALARARFS